MQNPLNVSAHASESLITKAFEVLLLNAARMDVDRVAIGLQHMQCSLRSHSIIASQRITLF